MVIHFMYKCKLVSMSDKYQSENQWFLHKRSRRNEHYIQQEILRTPYLTRHRTGQVERLMASDQIEAKIMKYHTVSGGGKSAVNLAKFNRKILLSSRSNWASWQMISHKHNWKQLVGSVDHGILFNMHSSYLLCSGSTVRMVKLQAQFRLHFYDLRGFTLNLAQPWTKFSNNETNNRIIIKHRGL